MITNNNIRRYNLIRAINPEHPLEEFDGIRVRDIDVDSILEDYFWDTDFLFDPAEFEKLGVEGRENMGFSEEAFGVVNGLRPHPDELVLKKGKAEPPLEILLFRDGEDYPFFEEDEAL